MSTPKCYSYLRFSNIKQKQGDSARRQLEAAEKYAKKNNLVLDTSLNLKDEGLSGFTGKHIEEGNLGKFLALVEAGKIERGSRLIIESIDRLGRQEPLTASDVIKKILRAGIMLVILDWYQVREFTDESIRNHPGEYSGLVAEIERAYFESKRKSDRLKEAWKEKRKKAENGGKKLTGACPMWLDLSKEKTEFIEKPEVIESIQKIFELKEEGYGNRKIAKTINNDPDLWQPPKSNRNKKGGWPTSTIQRFISDKRLLGEFQPHKRIDGKREEVGDPIPDYYPKVIDKETFYSVQRKMKEWREKFGKRGGRANKAKNLFKHVAVCGKCGSPLHYVHKGSKGMKGGYLHCYLSKQPSRAKKGEKCDARPIHYLHFRDTFFDHVKNLQPSDILPSADEHSEQLKELNKLINANGGKIDELVRKIDNLMNNIADEDSKHIQEKFKQRIVKLEEEREELVKQNTQLIQDRISLEKDASEKANDLNKLDKVRGLLGSTKSEEEAKEIRIKVRNAIKKVIDKIEVFPSTKTTGKYDKVRITFNGVEPFAQLLTFKKDGWSELSRTKEPKNWKKTA